MYTTILHTVRIAPTIQAYCPCSALRRQLLEHWQRTATLTIYTGQNARKAHVIVLLLVMQLPQIMQKCFTSIHNINIQKAGP